jgi:hypothetical protein
MVSSSPSVDELVLPLRLGDHDLALGGEILGDVDQDALGLVDVAQKIGRASCRERVS